MIHELPHANIHAYEGKKVRYARVAPDKKKFFRRLVSIDLTIFTICILTYFVINTLSPSRLENVTYMLMRGGLLEVFAVLFVVYGLFLYLLYTKKYQKNIERITLHKDGIDLMCGNETIQLHQQDIGSIQLITPYTGTRHLLIDFRFPSPIHVSSLTIPIEENGHSIYLNTEHLEGILKELFPSQTTGILTTSSQVEYHEDCLEEAPKPIKVLHDTIWERKDENNAISLIKLYNRFGLPAAFGAQIGLMVFALLFFSGLCSFQQGGGLFSFMLSGCVLSGIIVAVISGQIRFQWINFQTPKTVQVGPSGISLEGENYYWGSIQKITIWALRYDYVHGGKYISLLTDHGSITIHSGLYQKHNSLEKAFEQAKQYGYSGKLIDHKNAFGTLRFKLQGI